MTEPVENLTPMAHGAQNRCFGCGQANDAGLHLEFLFAADGSIVSFATIPDTFEGPPGFVHGGIIATLLDEAMSKAVRARGLTAMTRHMEIDYLHPVPSAVAIRIEGRVVRSEGRKHWTEARILNTKADTLAAGKGLFIEIPDNRVHDHRLAAARRPEDSPSLLELGKIGSLRRPRES